MEIKSAKFLKSSSDYKGCPTPDKPEFAFIGRSNVGKSSLINMLCNQKDLAKTSSKPGKTQLINHFSINSDQWYLVDLPGYGYAKTSKTNLDKFEELISNYITKRKNLISVMILIDSRLELQPIDGQFMEWCAEHEIPFCLVFTKTDKLGKNQWASNFAKYKKRLTDYWGEDIPVMIATSAEKKQGKDEVLNYIEENLQYFIPPPRGAKHTEEDEAYNDGI